LAHICRLKEAKFNTSFLKPQIVKTLEKQNTKLNTIKNNIQKLQNPAGLKRKKETCTMVVLEQ